MRIYFAGIGGMAIGPLAEIAKKAGHEVSGSDRQAGAMTDHLATKGIQVAITPDGGDIAAAHQARPIDWIVVSSAISTDHPVQIFAKKHGIKVTKRDALINKIICCDKKQKLLAVAGTHGKTTTTAMLIWLFRQFDIPASYSVGTLLGFAPSGNYADSAEYFIYEADEYDRNMLQFEPYRSIIPSLDYDHPDTYPTVADYKKAFVDFLGQSQRSYAWLKDIAYLGLKPNKRITPADYLLTHVDALTLAGEHTRHNALLAAACFDELYPEFGFEQIVAALNEFPGTWRRFEKLADNLYTTYAHHPAEVAANIQMARELAKKVVVVYQPHQNLRQHSIIHEYKDCFAGADHVYWLPTYLTREDSALKVLEPQDFIAKLAHPKIVEPALLDDSLVRAIKKARSHGNLVLCMGAGDIDDWLRSNLSKL